jgi:hypothetical protein
MTEQGQALFYFTSLNISAYSIISMARSFVRRGLSSLRFDVVVSLTHRIPKRHHEIFIEELKQHQV